MTLPGQERGATAVFVAISLAFLMAAAALAVDASGFFQTARADQTIADLSCLAGVHELPGDPSAAIDEAAAVAELNWPAMSAATLTVAGSNAVLADGAGNMVTFEAGANGDPEVLQVTVTERAPAYFGRAVGVASTDITQTATCQVEVTSSGGGALPFGILPGGFAGGLFGPNPCGSNSGNCGSLFVARSDVNGTGPTLIKNIGEGADRVLQPWLGPLSGSSRNCDAVGSGEVCHVISTDTGVSAAHIGQGYVNRLRDDPGADCTLSVGGATLNCDTQAQILGAAPTPLSTVFGAAPVWWVPSLYGAWPPSPSVHFYYDGVIAKCDSPRLATVPIVSSNLNWTIGDPNPGWPNGKKDMKIVGMVDVIIVDPNDAGDFLGSGNLKASSAIVMWYGPNARCATGGAYGLLNGAGGIPIKTVKLVAG
jgi:Flp pilus assembly protein TadG